MLRKLMIVCVALSATAGVAVGRSHGASAQGAVLCGLLRIPHLAASPASGTSLGRGTPIYTTHSGDLPCNSLIVSEPPTMPPTTGGSAASKTTASGPTVNQVVHCRYSFDLALTPTATDPTVYTGSGFVDVNWSDGGFTEAGVLAVATVSSVGKVVAIQLTGPVNVGRFSNAGGLLTLSLAYVGNLPAVQLGVVFA